MRTLRLDLAGDALLSGTFTDLQASSLWPATASLGCCSVQMLSVRGPRWDPEGIGSVFQDDPEGCDVLLVDGPLTRASRLELPRLVARMAEPRWVMAIGSCAVGGGVFSGGYAVEGGVDEVVPVDVFVPGCPPSSEAVLLGLVRLSELIRRGGGPHFRVPSEEGGVL
jgi:NADH:ubiquinone oxidoreductase subunit B-like Fe-S oxidoreductase